MSIHTCPKGHDSTESDFCSECGAKILGAPALENLDSAPTKPPVKTAQTCPGCAAPHELNSGNFCEICGYNFVTGAQGEIAIAPTASPDTVRQKVETPTNSAVTQSSTWSLVITVDPTLRLPESPLPPDQSAIALPLNSSTHLVGRTSQARAIYPEIALDFDDAVSHRHAIFTLQSDGTLILRDIGSSNGTILNGLDLPAMTDTTIQPGDEITLGHWTRIKVIAS